MILALDLGTSSARAMLYEAGGTAVGPGKQIHYHPRVSADGAVEHDAGKILDAAARCVDAVVAGAADVEAVGLSTFWHGLVGVDADGRAVTPVYMYSDTRSAAIARELRGALDEVAVRARTGCPLHSSYWPAKLCWLRATAPAVRPERWGSIGELLGAAWLGEPVTSISMGSATGLFDQAANRWDQAMLSAAGIDERQLFPLVDLDHAMALRLPWARRWPALARARWYPAIGDGAAGTVGSGCTDRTRIAINVGTSSAMRLITDAPPAAPPWGLWRYRLDARRAVVGGSLSEGGDVYAWCLETFHAGDPTALERGLAESAGQDHGLTVLPFWAGERSPGWSPDARGAIAGLSLSTTAADLVRAALEAVALRLALIHDRLGPLAAGGYEVVASGGALARSRAWARMIADALGRRIHVGQAPEASSRGVALLAEAALGSAFDLAAAARVATDAIEPDALRMERFRALGERQARLYTAVLGAPPLHSPPLPL